MAMKKAKKAKKTIKRLKKANSLQHTKPLLALFKGAKD
jgi:hypothetical protein